MPEESAQEQLMTSAERGSRPEYTPQRKPERLSANPQKRVRQLEAIASSPTEGQRQLVAEKIQRENPDLGQDDALSMADTHFRNYATVANEARVQQSQVRQATSEALRAGTVEEQNERRGVLKSLKNQVREVIGERNEMAAWFRDVGLQVEPEQQHPGLTIAEKMEKAAFGVGVRGAELTASVGQRARRGKEAVGRGARKAGEVGIRTAKSGVETGRRGARRGRELTGAGVRSTREGAGGAASGVGRYIQETGSAMAEMYRQDWRDIKGVAGQGGEALKGNVGVARDAAVGLAGAARDEYQRRMAVSRKIEDRERAEIARVARAGLEKVGGIGRGIVESASANLEVGRFAIRGLSGAAREQLREAGAGFRQVVSEFTNAVGGAVSQQVESAGSFWNKLKGKVDSGLERGGNALNARLDKWGESASNKLSEFNENVVKKVVESTRGAWEKTQAPFKKAWAAIERERPGVREKTGLLTGRMAIVVEEQKDKAAPIVAAISGLAQEKADRIFGKPARFLRLMGGRALITAEMVAASPRVQAIKDRLEGWAGQANEARKRIGEFMGRMGRKASTGSDAAVSWDDQGLVTPDSQKEAANWIRNSKETIGRFFENVQKWQVFEAIKRWKESGMTDRDVSRREKIMRAIHAASLGRAAAVGGAVVVEGVSGATRFAREHKKATAAVLVGAGALAYVLLGNPDLSGTINQIVSSVSGLGGGEVASNLTPDIMPGGLPPVVDTAQAANIPNIPVTDAASYVDYTSTTETARSVGASIGPNPEISPAGEAARAIGGGTENLATPIDTTPGTNEIGRVDNLQPAQPPAGADTGEAARSGVQLPNQLPRTGELLFNPTDILRGEPVYPQAERLASQLPGGASVENVTRVMGQIFSNFQGDFADSAQAIVNSTDPAMDALKADAQRQLDAIAQIRQNPTAANQYATLSDAMHFWSR